MEPAIEFENLTVTYQPIGEEAVEIIHGISSQFDDKKITGIIGESGSGKSVTMKALMDLLPDRLFADFDQFSFQGQAYTGDRLALPMAMIFQDALGSLDPLRTIGYHLEEVIRRYNPDMANDAVNQLMVESLSEVGLSEPAKQLDQYPHELSGGQNQRINIAMALLTQPALLIADEPTTALDVTTQKQILNLLLEKKADNDLTIILVTHDLAVVSEICDEVKVMYDGYILEEAAVEEIFTNPLHPYTRELIKAMPRGKNRERLYTMPEFELSDEEKEKNNLVEVSANHRVLEGAHD